MYRIETDVLIPGRGQPIRQGVVVITQRSITFAGPAADAPLAKGATSLKVPAVMPGMWDCHGHFMGLVRPDIEDLIGLSLPLATARSLRDAGTALAGGFTSIREPGGLGNYLAEAIADGVAVGPHIYSAARALSTTGGHGDIHGFPLDVVRGHDDFGELCDGVPECLRAVRRQLRLGARLIKVCASGGVMSEVDHPVHQQFSGEELSAIVEEAGRAERIVAAHCHGKPGIMAALEAGAKTIEHGTYLDREAAELMLSKEAILVPTRFIIEQLLGMKDELPPYAYDKAVLVADRHLEALRLAIDMGVTIAVGTDNFVSGNRWTMSGRELQYLVEAGMTPLGAIEAATANGPLTLGPQAPQAGQLIPGYDADVIALDSDPLDNVALLGNPDNITHVWKAGELVKSPS